MYKKLIAAAALCMAAAPFASATTISLTFDYFAYGTDIHNYYNGGRDSLNRLGGENYGISFSNDSVRYTDRGGYLSGSVLMTLDANKIRAILGSDNYYISFSGAIDYSDWGLASVGYEDGSYDSVPLHTNWNPYCHTYPGGPAPTGPEVGACDMRDFGYLGGHYTYPGAVTRISFYTSRLDNIQIHSYTGSETLVRPASYYQGANIPEPGSLALLGAGAISFVLRGRRKKKVL